MGEEVSGLQAQVEALKLMMKPSAPPEEVERRELVNTASNKVKKK
jgi:hypothetical protein